MAAFPPGADLGDTVAWKPAGPAPSYGDIWQANWDESRKASNFDAHLYNYSLAFDDIETRVKAATGEMLGNPFRDAGPLEATELLGAFSRQGVDASSSLVRWRAELDRIAAAHPGKLDWTSIRDEPGQTAFQAMRKAREHADEIGERAGLVNPRDMIGGKVPLIGPFLGVPQALAVNTLTRPGSTATQLAANFAAQMTSPADAAVNLISFGIGGAAKSLLRNATQNALSNMAGQAILSTPKQWSYQSAGLPYGLQIWAEEVAAAGGAGFALDLGVRGVGRTAIQTLGRDTPAGTYFSRNTPRGGMVLDAVTDATPPPRPSRAGLDIAPETVRKARDEGDVAASREILEKTGAIRDPSLRRLVEVVETTGRIDEEGLRALEAMGVAKPDGLRMLADAIAGREAGPLPPPIPPAAGPLEPDRGRAVARQLSGPGRAAFGQLPRVLQQAIVDGLEAGEPRILDAVERAIPGASETLAARLAEALDSRLVAVSMIHGGRLAPVELAGMLRREPDLLDAGMPVDSRPVALARDLARLDDEAFGAVVEGRVPDEVGALVATRVPAAQQARVLADLERVRPDSLAAATALIDKLVTPEQVPSERPAVPATDAEASARMEALRGEAGQAFEEAMAPVRRREAIDSEIEAKRGQIAKLDEEARKEPPPLPGKDSESGDDAAFARRETIARLTGEIRALEEERAQLLADAEPGRQLGQVAARALDLAREADVARAVRDALLFGQRILPAGTRISVLPDDAMVARAANGDRVALDGMSDPETGHIRLAIGALDPTATLGHEGVHTLVTLGHLSPAEVDALAALAREAGTFTKAAKYEQVGVGEGNRRLVEEAAASYIEARLRGDVTGPPNTVVERIRQLMERIRRLLAGYGFQSREDVVQAILSGAAARREARAEWSRQATEDGRRAMRAAAERGVEIDGVTVQGVPLFAIRAFHGSPHDFDRFDLSKIGTGEGAQAYGYGLYFAESGAVARSYRDALSGASMPRWRLDGKLIAPSLIRDPVIGNIIVALQQHNLSLDRAIEYLEKHAATDPRLDKRPIFMAAAREATDWRDRGRFDPRIDTSPGHLYEVRIDAEPDQFIDWDASLSQQSEAVRDALAPLAEEIRNTAGSDALKKIFGKRYPGDVSGSLTDLNIKQIQSVFTGSPADLTARLRAAGIAGIRYKDAVSRGSDGEGTYNYVIFDDARIEIVAKDGQKLRGDGPEAGGQLFSIADADERVLARDRAAANLRRGITVHIPKDVRQAGHAVLAPLLHVVPDGASVGMLRKVVPGPPPLPGTKGERHVTAHYELPDGREVSAGLTVDILLESRAARIPGQLVSDGRDALVFHRFGGAAADGGETLRGELWHELTHQLRRRERLSGRVWERLVGHAHSLRILDRELATYLRTIGQPGWQRATGTLAESYGYAYRGSPDLKERFDQEAVAHMLELHAHNQLLPHEIGPVEDIVKGIREGQFSRDQTAAVPLRPEADGVYGALFSLADRETGQSMRRDLDALGYYSKALEAARGLKQAKGTPEQMLAQLKKAGVKDAEIAATGLRALLDGKTSITRDEIVENMEGRRIRLSEVIRGRSKYDEALHLLRAIEEQLARPGVAPERRRQLENARYRLNQNRLRINLLDDHLAQQREGTAAKWAAYSLDPSNPTYRETVLHLPESVDKLREKRMAELNRLVDKYGHLSNAPPDERAAFDALDQAYYDQRPDRVDFRSGHFPEPNIIGHMMTSLVGHDGQAVYLVDQIQSDWGQKIRDEGARDEAKIKDLKRQIEEVLGDADRDWLRETPGGDVDRAFRNARDQLGAEHPTTESLRNVDYHEHRRLLAELHTAETASAIGHPLVNTTDQWVDTTLRRAIRQAAEAGAKFMAIPSGETVLSYNGGDENGMRGFYGGGSSIRKVDSETIAEAKRFIAEKSGKDPEEAWGYVNEAEYVDLAETKYGFRVPRIAAKPVEGIVPKNLRKLLAALDKATPPPERIDTLDSPSGKTGLGKGFTLFRLTDAVKRAVMEEGQPLFSIAEERSEGTEPHDSRPLATDMAAVDRMTRMAELVGACRA